MYSHNNTNSRWELHRRSRRVQPREIGRTVLSTGKPPSVNQRHSCAVLKEYTVYMYAIDELLRVELPAESRLNAYALRHLGKSQFIYVMLRYAKGIIKTCY